MNNQENIKLIDNGIGSRLRELRHHYNLSLKEFGLKAGISDAAIFKMELGKTKRPHAASLKKIISAYGVSFEWLYYGIGDMLPNGRNVFENINGKALLKIASCNSQCCLELTQKNKKLEKEVERLWQLIDHLTQQQIRIAKFSSN